MAPKKQKAPQQQQHPQPPPKAEAKDTWREAVTAFAATPDATWTLAVPGVGDTEVQILFVEGGTMRLKPTAADQGPISVTEAEFKQTRATLTRRPPAESAFMRWMRQTVVAQAGSPPAQADVPEAGTAQQRAAAFARLAAEASLLPKNSICEVQRNKDEWKPAFLLNNGADGQQVRFALINESAADLCFTAESPVAELNEWRIRPTPPPLPAAATHGGADKPATTVASNGDAATVQQAAAAIGSSSTQMLPKGKIGNDPAPSSSPGGGAISTTNDTEPTRAGTAPPCNPPPTNPNFRSRVQTVTSHAAEYVHRWYVVPSNPIGARELHAARVLAAAGRGSARIPTCEHTLRTVWSLGAKVEGWEPLVRRALSLFGPGELSALSVGGSKAFTVISAMLKEKGKRGGASSTTLSEALAAPRAMCTQFVVPEDAVAAFALVERYAATLTEVDFLLMTQNGMIQAGSAMDRILPRCTRLETLGVWRHAPRAWLGLSQLHTLRHVDLTTVSPKALATAALPRLHTLHAFCESPAMAFMFELDEFFDTLLPRLRSFHFDGYWPDHDSYEGLPTKFRPLPLLRDLEWNGHDCDSNNPTGRPAPLEMPYGLMGARPSTLNAHQSAIVHWLDLAEHVQGEAAVMANDGPLVNVRDLTTQFEKLDQKVPEFGGILLSAPQLRRLELDVYSKKNSITCLTSPSVPDPALEGLVHKRLREIAITCKRFPRPLAVTKDFAVTLRQRHFPQLRSFRLDDEQYAVVRTS